MSQLLLKYGGAASNTELSVEDHRSKYLKNGTDFPFVNIPEKYESAKKLNHKILFIVCLAIDEMFS